MANDLTVEVAKQILAEYQRYTDSFLSLTLRARDRFEKSDWQGRFADALERYDLYEASLDATALRLRHLLGAEESSRLSVWKEIKGKFHKLVAKRHDAELAETYYNSVTRKLLWTVGLDREIEFFHQESKPCPVPLDEAIVTVYPYEYDTSRIISAILRDLGYSIPFEDLDGDAARVANEIDLFVWPLTRYQSISSIQILKCPFYRNKVAYVVGRILAGDHVIPLVLPLYNGQGEIYVDTVLLSEAEVSRVFSFAFSYFQVELRRHDVVIDFLKSILPHKPVAELYISIGLNKHGKTVLYRDLHRYVHVSKEKFQIAPGREGAVMIAFTLPDYDFVLKIIKDQPCFLRTADVTPKRNTRAEVMEQYDFVCHRDRVGRLVDTQEFENLRFKKKRFASNLLREFEMAASEVVTIERDYVVIKHLYIQRKVIPLPMYLLSETEPELLRKVILDFGYFLKDLASVGIFPYDLFNIWNYGVTRRGRVVLFDYDDVQPLERAHFKNKPAPRGETEEMQLEEDRITVTGDDFFLEEADQFSGIPRPLKGIFKAVHSDLYTLRFWKDMKRRVRRGEQFDITPYDRGRKFVRHPLPH
ncbi:MAG: bifunctional isocitrate dehydrogenase kinase/phosphatase [Candidatus Zixiibacteriota bacterium]